MAYENYIKEHQEDFNSMVDAADAMAQEWIAQGFDPWATSALHDVREAKEWRRFMSSEFYDLYNKIVLPLKVSGLSEPGRAFKLFTAAIEENLKTEVVSFKRNLFIAFFNDRLKIATRSEDLIFAYQTAPSIHNHQPAREQESELYKILLAPFTFLGQLGLGSKAKTSAEPQPEHNHSRLSN